MVGQNTLENAPVDQDNLFVEDGFEDPYTQVPNLILDHMAHFQDSSLRVLLYLVRQTYGYHRQRARITITQIGQGTGRSEMAVHRALARLARDGRFLRIEQRHARNGAQLPNIYTLTFRLSGR